MEALRSFESRHLPGLLALWSRRWGASFPLDRALWSQNTEGDLRHFHAERCWIIEERGTVAGALVLKTPATPPAWPGQPPQHAWMSFLLAEPGRDQEIAPVLIRRALAWLRSRPFARVSYGGDPSHFFPGAPEDDVAVGQALAAAGLRPGGLAHDLLGDLRQDTLREDALHKDTRRLLHAPAAPVGPCRDNEVSALLRFVDAEFPGRWAYETRQRLDSEPSPADVIVARSAGDIVGFCHVYHRGSRRIGPSIYWRAAIGDRYGGLGPIGVHRAFRGQGLGHAVLAFALEHLRQLGVERAVIDWTALADFYGRFGFRIWRTYRSWSLDL